MYEINRLRSFDLETHLIIPGNPAPPIVCGSWARSTTETGVSEFPTITEIARVLLNGDDAGGDVIVGANIAYDMACLAAADSSILRLIFKAYVERRVFDVQIAAAMDAIAAGHLGIDPRTGGKTSDPETGKASGRYSLAICTDLVLGRKNAKEHDFWRLRYALLEGIPMNAWPEEARQYCSDDAVNTLEVALAQLRGMPYHDSAGTVAPARNLDDHAAQCETAFALHLGAVWGIRTDKGRIEKLAAEVEKKHADAAVRFKAKGWIREDGTEDQAAVKRAVARAYFATGVCPRCQGSGRVPSEKTKSTVICKDLGMSAPGCDGTGLDLSTASMLPRTEKNGVKTDRDTLMESGDDDLHDYGEDEFEKIRSTYLPYLRRGLDVPLNLRPNVIVATGRCSYDTIHQFPREGGVRECVRAREGYVLGSTDYEAGELCTLSQFCYWVLGFSKMRDEINASGKPGILHSALASEVLGISLDDFMVRLKVKDEQAVKFRQASKPINFGVPGGMGAAKLVLTSRKKNAGSTELPNGSKVAGIRFCILIGGAKQCGIEKITQWKDRDCAPVCKACVEVVENILRPAYFNRFPEIKEYFKWVSDCIEEDATVPCLVWDRESEGPKITRLRGGVDFSAACNNGFQAMLSDAGKLAYRLMTREAYTERTSSLWGARFPIFLHDEPLSELPMETAHLAGPRIAEIMVQSGRAVAPDVVWKAETALSFFWSKSMEPVYIDGKLVPWEPKGGW